MPKGEEEVDEEEEEDPKSDHEAEEVSEGPTPEGSDEGPTPEGSDEGPTPEGSDEGPTPEGSGDEGEITEVGSDAGERGDNEEESSSNGSSNDVTIEHEINKEEGAVEDDDEVDDDEGNEEGDEMINEGAEECNEVDESGREVEEVKEIDEAEVVELSGDDDEETENERKKKEEDVVDTAPEESDSEGDSSRAPGEDATRPIEPMLLLPFKYGWKRECVQRCVRNGNHECDVYYIPPLSKELTAREAKRKRRSKNDQEKYFEDFPHEELSVINFSYVRRPLGLNNAAYEIVRNARDGLRGGTSSKAVFNQNRRGSVNYKEVDETAGLVSESDNDDDDIMEEFSMEIPIVLQVTNSIIGMKAEYKKRRKIRDRNRCMTPPLAEERLWTNLDDDPLGVHTALGGRSTTPPPLRALKLTPNATAEKIINALNEVKKEAAKTDLLEEQEMKENLASHDYVIRKYKNYVERSALKNVPGYSSTASSSSFSLHQRKFNQQRPQPTQRSFLPCTLHCPGANGFLPNLSCVSCHCLFHSRCQGVSPSVKVFKCRACCSVSSRPSLSVDRQNSRFRRNFPTSNDVVRVKLPMTTQNGRRPVVELVMQQNGRYQPIKFSNNMQVTEAIPKTLFDQASALRKTVYQKAIQVPRVGGRQIYLAINPSNTSRFPQQQQQQQQQPQQPQAQRRQQPSLHPSPQSDQVAILVKPLKNGIAGKPVLLNVPRKIAVKVKIGTTLSFSASSDQKYTVIDNKIRPAVSVNKPSSAAPRPPPSNLVSQGLARYNQLTVSRISASPATGVRPAPTRGVSILPATTSNRRRPLPLPSNAGIPPPKRRSLGNVLSTGEVVGGTPEVTMTPCTPYCPGVTGFPEMECNGCQSLFHSKCVGVPPNAIQKIKSTFRCKMCASSSVKGTTTTTRPGTAAPQVIDLD